MGGEENKACDAEAADEPQHTQFEQPMSRTREFTFLEDEAVASMSEHKYQYLSARSRSMGSKMEMFATPIRCVKSETPSAFWLAA